ncbi:MAG TPA: tetratricopeptide repeat protein [Deltaproteobacteria bacterium]|nr:tetratricopeptide repeat protein [Deltaproteobacteria bacterium]
MKFSRFFTGKPYQEIERNGDAFLEVGQYGSAKLEYERALAKLLKRPSGESGPEDRLRKKIAQSREGLALEHRDAAENLVETGHYEEAEELLRLALELVGDKASALEIEERLRLVRDGITNEETPEDPLGGDTLKEGMEILHQGSDEEYFTALISTLPEEEQESYLRYRDPFRDGYIKLHQGRFEDAVPLLSQALETNLPVGGFILLELATAHLNLGNHSEGLTLLQAFLKEHPQCLRAYGPLCEILWQNKEFDEAQRLLTNCPEPLSGSPVIHLLYGKTLFHAGKYHDARVHYLDYLHVSGWNEAIALALAKTFEALGEREKALEQYSGIMNRCQGCGSRIDPLIKQRYADISLEAGDYSTEILELYLGLIQEVPENRADYYRKISMIYEVNGNTEEARRFRSFAERSRREG